MESMAVDVEISTPPRITRRRKSKKTSMRHKQQTPQINNNNEDPPPCTEWKTQAQQQVYSSKLLKALREVRISSSPPQASAPKGGRAVREVADRVLAVTAKGRSRWSRALLTNRRLKLKFMKRHSKRQKMSRSVTKKPRMAGGLKLKTKTKTKSFQKKARVLGRLVPGCRKQPLPVILDEATDYIAALEMQVRAMTALADLLSAASSPQ